MEKWLGPTLKLRSAHETVGWLGSGPGELIIISECNNPNCGCHQAVKEAKERGIHFMHLKSSAD